MSALSQLMDLPEAEKVKRGLVHTPAEIAQQPDTWGATVELFRSKREEIRNFLSAGELTGPGASHVIVFLVGAGTSDYTGQAVSHLLRKHWRCEVIAVPSTDLLTQMDELILTGRKYLWISFSRSGDSSEGVAVLARAREKYPDIYHIVISCNPHGRMLREGSGNPKTLGICMIDEANDRGLAMTSSFSNMVIFAQCMAHIASLETYESVLGKLVAAGKSLLPRAADCAAALAKQGYKKAFFVGSGPLRAVAKESALKVLELTAGKTLTMTESALGLRHGPMAALDDQTLFVCFLSSDKRVQGYERDLLREIGAKKIAKRRVVVGGSDLATDSYAEDYLSPASVSGIADEYRAPVDVMFGQLLGLFSSIQWNLMPDSPSPDGVINRVVQDVNIYS
ncbi:MAG: putative tagatose-6-phosphate aldose/ketose isomerase [Acidobacteriaceae bacterium]|nr:putative tagatose-6-phosphate aldose/ketose isomerase [Acidobacteriaceae bacterium]